MNQPLPRPALALRQQVVEHRQPALNLGVPDSDRRIPGPAAFAVPGPLVKSDEWLFGRLASEASYRATKKRPATFEWLLDKALYSFARYRSRAALKRITWAVWKLHDRRWRSGAWARGFAGVQSARARRPSIARLLAVEPRDRRIMAIRAAGRPWAACARAEGVAESTAHGAPGRLARLRAWRMRRQGAAIRPGDTAGKVLRRIGYRELTAEPALRLDVAELCARVRERIAWWRSDPPFPRAGWLPSGAITSACKQAVYLWLKRHLRPADWPPGFGCGLRAARQSALRL